jgi:hypothetical protein
LSLAESQGRPRRPRALAVMPGLSGIFLVAAPPLIAAPSWVNSVSPFWGGVLISGAVLLLISKPLRMGQYPHAVAVLSAGMLAIVYLGVFRNAAPAYDLREASRVIAAAEAAGRPVASLSDYHGQFGFYGRLARPIENLPPDQALAWSREHPGGYLIATYPDRVPGYSAAVHEQPYRGGHLVIWEGRVLAADPALLP